MTPIIHDATPEPGARPPHRSLAGLAGVLASVAGPAKRSPAWRSADILRAVLIAITVIAALRGLWAASTVLIVAFLGVLFGLALSAVVDRLARLRVPRALGAALVVVTAFGSLAILGVALAPTVAEQGAEIQARLPEAIRRGEAWINDRERSALRMATGRRAGPMPGSTAVSRHTGDSTIAAQAPTSAATAPGPSVASQVTQGLAGLSSYFFGFLGSTVELVAYLLLTLFLAIYVAADPALYRRGLMHLFPHRVRRRAGEVMSAVAVVLRKWLLTQVIAMVTLGVAWAVALSVLHVRAAIALAVIAAFLEFIPTIGPTIAVVPALGMAALDSPEKVVWVLGIYLVIQALESNVLIPMLMQGRINLPPALTILAQALMALAFGFLGLMVAVPVLAAVMVPVQLLYVEDVVGDSGMETGTIVTENEAVRQTPREEPMAMSPV